MKVKKQEEVKIMKVEKQEEAKIMKVEKQGTDLRVSPSRTANSQNIPNCPSLPEATICQMILEVMTEKGGKTRKKNLDYTGQ